MFEERDAMLRELQVSWCPLDKPTAKPAFETLELQANRPLGGSHGFGCTREAVELGDVKEGLDGIQVEGAISHFQSSSQLSWAIAYQNSAVVAIEKM
jgi:hypothetical protein